MTRKVFAVLALSVSLAQGLTASGVAPRQPENDRNGAIAATLRYRDAWRANNAALVMATLTADAVLLPSGLEPIIGAKAIREFWWPSAGPSTTVISMEQNVDEVVANGSVAVVRGHGSVSFVSTQAGKKESRLSRHTFLNIVRRQTDGSWLIAQRMWSDLH